MLLLLLFCILDPVFFVLWVWLCIEFIYFLTTTKRPRRGRAKQVTNLYVCMYMYIRCAIFQESRRVSVIWKPAFVIMAYFLFVFFFFLMLLVLLLFLWPFFGYFHIREYVYALTTAAGYLILSFLLFYGIVIVIVYITECLRVFVFFGGHSMLSLLAYLYDL